jgi:hypothetical protein
VPAFPDPTIAARRLRIERYLVLVGEAITRTTRSLDDHESA